MNFPERAVFPAENPTVRKRGTLWEEKRGSLKKIFSWAPEKGVKADICCNMEWIRLDSGGEGA